MKTESGYPPLDYYNIDPVTAHFLNTGPDDPNIHYFESLESTNSKAKELLKNGTEPPFFVIAEEQSGGKGRMKRSWYSPYRQGLWISIAFPVYTDVKTAGYYNYIITLAVAEAVKRTTGLNTEFKWPNDIQIGSRKICGILSENRVAPDGSMSMITGAGININIGRDDFIAALNSIATSLSIEAGRDIDRNIVYRSYTRAVAGLYLRWQETGIEDIFEEWKIRCNTIGKIVTINSGKSPITGKAVDVNLDGSLQLEDESGQLKTIYAGDVEYTVK